MYLGLLVISALLIAIYCLVFFIRRVVAYKKGADNHCVPGITMVFMVRNQENFIEGLIRKVFVDTCTASVEIIAVDLGSVDQTRMILERLGECFRGFHCLFAENEPGLLKKVYDLCQGNTIYCFDLTNPVNLNLMLRTIHSITQGSATCLYRTKVLYKQQNLGRPDTGTT